VSAFTQMSPELQAMQRDEAANPAMLWVGEGAALWDEPAGAAGRSCADCHGDARRSMRGVAARYPAFDELEGRPVDLATRIDLCRARHQKAEAFSPESDELLSLAAFVGLQSRGLPIVADDDPRLVPFRERGRALFERRIGQLDFACSQCHDDNWGRRLAGSPIPQGHPTGYPIYRLEWQTLGSLQRRFRNCMTGVRAQPYAYGAPEFVELELYLMSRAAGLPIETPAVRP
jgi:sulfur-oxidizing protein SoxA